MLRWSPRVLLCGLIVASVLLMHVPCRQVNVVSTVISRGTSTLPNEPAGESVVIYRAGVPWQYYWAVEAPGGPTAVRISWASLMANLVSLVLLCAAVWYYETSSTRSAPLKSAKLSEPDTNEPDASEPDASEPDKRQPVSASSRRFGLRDLVMATTLVAIVLGYWQAEGYRAQRELKAVEQLQCEGSVATLQTHIAWWLERQVPNSFWKRYRRIGRLVLNQPSDTEVRFALECRSLESLVLQDGAYDLRLLDQLRHLPLLHELRVMGRQLDAGAIAAIGSCKQVRSLNLTRTNITAADVEALGEMPRLNRLNLMHSDVQLGQLGRPALAQTLRELTLPHPNPGQGDQLVLEEWPELTTLAINQDDTPSNSEPVRLMLGRLPKLKKLGLDVFQRFELTIADVPELHSITPLADQTAARGSPDMPTQWACWISRLQVINSGLVEPLAVQALALEQVEMENAGGWKLRLIAPEVKRQVQVMSAGLPGRLSIPPIDLAGGQAVAEVGSREQVQGLLDQLGRCRGLQLIDLSGWQLSGRPSGAIHLDQMLACPTLQVLNLSGTGLGVDEIRKLGRCQSLTELNLIGVLGDSKTFSQVIRELPQLKRLLIGPGAMDGMVVENSAIEAINRASVTNQSHRNLEVPFAFVRSGQLQFAGEVPAKDVAARLVNLPRLQADVNYFAPLTSVHIENVPALDRLRFHRPLPPATVIAGLQGLTCFAGGGKHLGDVHFEALLPCSAMRTLCLMYSGITADKLKELHRFPQLLCLSLTGSDVTDEVVAAWKSFPQLRTLRLDQTKVTKAAFNRLDVLCPLLDRLTIDTPLDVAQQMAVARCRGLSELTIHGSPMSVEFIQALSKLPLLAYLDLSGCTLDTAATKELQTNFPNLQQLVLIDTQLDRREAARLALARPGAEVHFRQPVSQSGMIKFQRDNIQQMQPNAVNVRLDSDEVWAEPFRSARP